jgi:hypothetical protein
VGLKLLQTRPCPKQLRLDHLEGGRLRQWALLVDHGDRLLVVSLRSTEVTATDQENLLD